MQLLNRQNLSLYTPQNHYHPNKNISDTQNSAILLLKTQNTTQQSIQTNAEISQFVQELRNQEYLYDIDKGDTTKNTSNSENESAPQISNFDKNSDVSAVSGYESSSSSYKMSTASVNSGEKIRKIIVSYKEISCDTKDLTTCSKYNSAATVTTCELSKLSTDLCIIDASVSKNSNSIGSCEKSVPVNKKAETEKMTAVSSNDLNPKSCDKLEVSNNNSKDATHCSKAKDNSLNFAMGSRYRSLDIQIISELNKNEETQAKKSKLH